jgi:hypothetical protein
MGHDETPAVLTAAPLNWKSDELLSEATGVAAEARTETASRANAGFKGYPGIILVSIHTLSQ